MDTHGSVLELLPGREVPLSPRRPMVEGIDARSTAPDDTIVTRLLPQRHRRTVGAWCFVDHYGPDDVSASVGMQVDAHPHTGLQTVSWLLAGDVRHRDTVRSDVVLKPGALGLMTAGRGIAHSERSPLDRPPTLHGVQLWVVLPEAARDVGPAFELHDDLPVVALGGQARARVMVGELAGARSPATTYTPIVGAELGIDGGGVATVPIDPAYEHALVVVDGAVTVDGHDQVVERGVLGYLGDGREQLRVMAPTRDGTRVLLLGGEPFEERLLMWWNFIGRTHTDVEQWRKAWNAEQAARETFGSIPGDDGPRMLAPALPTVTLKPRGRTG